jgi:glycerol-3-phosphate acyltransferase PlsY
MRFSAPIVRYLFRIGKAEAGVDKAGGGGGRNGLPDRGGGCYVPRMHWLAGFALGFGCGSLPFGYWAGRLRGIDIREHGSRNIGATNVIRVLGKGVGVPVFALDVLKGWLPCALASGWGGGSAVVVLAGLGAVLGHVFTPWLGFKGGKGVATAAGVLAGVAPVPMLAALGAWLLVFFTTRFVSLASMVSAVAVPATMAVVMARSGVWDWVMLGFGLLLAVLVLVRHRGNLRRLLDGTEPRAGAGKSSAVKGGGK